MDNTFVMGAVNVFTTETEGEIAFEGKAKGEISVSDKIEVTNLGSDNLETTTATVTQIGFRSGDSIQTVQSAKDRNMIVYVTLENPVSVRTGVVLCTPGTDPEEKHAAYVNVLGNVFVAARDLNLEDKEFEHFSVTDCVELYNCFVKFHARRQEKDKQKEENVAKLEKLAFILGRKLFSCESLYAVYSTRTADTFMFSKLFRQGRGFSSTLPNVMVVTPNYVDRVKAEFKEDAYEFVKINGKNLFNFFGGCFYVNGASGVLVNCTSVRVPAEMVVKKPEETDDEANVANPDLVRWVLLMGQTEESVNSVATTSYVIYKEEMERELLKAKFLLPTKPGKDGYQVGIMKKEAQRDAVAFFTDWGKLRVAYDGTWGAILKTVDEMYEEYNILVNPLKTSAKVLLFTQEDIERIKKKVQ